MTRPKKEQVSISDTPYYHIVSRCVRRSFLCGSDKHTGKNYEHRRQWIEDRIRLLSSIFAIDICAYAVMSNHIHIAVNLHPEPVEKLSQDEILTRWCCLYKGPTLVQQWRHAFNVPIKPLQHFESSIRDEEQRGILFSFSDYLKLIDATGRCIRQDKRGSIPHHIKPILQRLNVYEQT